VTLLIAMYIGRHSHNLLHWFPPPQPFCPPPPILQSRLPPPLRCLHVVTPTWVRVRIGTFNTPGEAANAYEVAAWRFGRPHRDMKS
jgi:hypothetical protein